MLASLLRLMDYRHFRGRIGPEDALAIEVATMLRAATLGGRLAGTWSHIPHEVGGGKGTSSQVRYALAKAMGLIAGSGDYVFAWPQGSAWIELKSASGSLNPAQKDFRDWCVATGVPYAVCKSLKQVEEKLLEWGVLRAE